MLDLVRTTVNTDPELNPPLQVTFNLLARTEMWLELPNAAEEPKVDFLNPITKGTKSLVWTGSS